MKKSPLAIFLTDTHKQKDNLELVFDIFIQALDLAEENDCKIVIHGGDFFTDRIGQNLQNLLLFHRILNEFEKRRIDLYAIPGNHDKTDQNSEESYLSIYKSPNFKLFKKQSCIKIGKINFGFLPYFSTSMEERIKDLNTKIKPDCKNILITHGSFNGVRNNDGSEVTEGLSVKTVKKWDKVLVGHYHDASFIEPNIYYTGSGYQGNYGENHFDKGFTIIYDNSDLEFVESTFKKYIKVKLNANDNIDDEIDIYSKMDANVRFIFQGDKTDFLKLNVKKLDELGIDSKFEWADINEEILKSETGEFGSISKNSIFKYFLEYCGLSEIPKEKRSNGLKILKQ